MVLGSPDQYWDGFYRFPSPVLGNCSKFSSAVLEVVLSFPVQHWDRFYRFPCPILGKGGICSKVQYLKKKVVGSPLQYLEKALLVHQSNTGKRF